MFYQIPQLGIKIVFPYFYFQPHLRIPIASVQNSYIFYTVLMDSTSESEKGTYNRNIHHKNEMLGLDLPKEPPRSVILEDAAIFLVSHALPHKRLHRVYAFSVQAVSQRNAGTAFCLQKEIPDN